MGLWRLAIIIYPLGMENTHSQGAFLVLVESNKGRRPVQGRRPWLELTPQCTGQSSVIAWGCCNGRWSLTWQSMIGTSTTLWGLNPCCNGIWSLTLNNMNALNELLDVLILVVMEYGLWLWRKCIKECQQLVLILVVMEYGLWLSYSYLQW